MGSLGFFVSKHIPCFKFQSPMETQLIYREITQHLTVLVTNRLYINTSNNFF